MSYSKLSLSILLRFSFSSKNTGNNFYRVRFFSLSKKCLALQNRRLFCALQASEGKADMENKTRGGRSAKKNASFQTTSVSRPPRPPRVSLRCL